MKILTTATIATLTALTFATPASAIQGQDIDTSQLPTTAAPGSSQQLVATATSGLPVTFDSRTPKVCKVTSAGFVTFGKGRLQTCRLSLEVAGNASYFAEEESHSIYVW